MDTSSQLQTLLFPLLFSALVLQISALGVGINYGRIANNLPPPSRVVNLLQSINITRVKLYDADPTVLTAFANTNIDFIIAIDNEDMANMKDPSKAQQWLSQNVQPHISQTKISCITVGNEVLSGNDTALTANLLPAMQSVYQALVTLGLSKQITVTTAHSLNILADSYPPSSGSFQPDLVQYIQPILNFHSQTNSPFLINAYPYFAYKADPQGVSLNYVLFQQNSGVTDPNTNLKYDNMLYAQIDSVYSAMKALGHSDVQLKISETGWPSKGDSNEAGANPENARIYNGNLVQRMAMNQGTPMKPSVPLDIYVFALFNEDMKPEPTSERNYGLFYPDGTPVYNIGMQRFLPSLVYSSSTKTKVMSGCGILALVIASLFLLQ